MTKKLFAGFVCLAMSIASAAAASYRVTLFQPSVVAGTELKPGDYKVDLQDNKVTIKNGKNTVEADVKVETVDQKYSTTSVRYSNGDGKYRLQEIRLGGTKTKLIFNN